MKQLDNVYPVWAARLSSKEEERRKKVEEVERECRQEIILWPEADEEEDGYETDDVLLWPSSEIEEKPTHPRRRM